MGLVLTVGAAVVILLTHKAPAPPPSVVTPAVTNVVIPKAFTELNDFKTSRITLKKNEYGGLVYAVGTVKNDTTRQRFGVKIELDLLDDQDAKIGDTSDYIAVLEPQTEWHFKALLTNPKAVKASLTTIEEEK